MDAPLLERQHDSLLRIIGGKRLARPAAFDPKHPERCASPGTIRPAEVRDFVFDFDAKRLSGKFAAHTAALTPASPIMAARDLVGCGAAAGKSTRTQSRLSQIGLTFTAQVAA